MRLWRKAELFFAEFLYETLCYIILYIAQFIQYDEFAVCTANRYANIAKI